MNLMERGFPIACGASASNFRLIEMKKLLNSVILLWLILGATALKAKPFGYELAWSPLAADVQEAR